MTENFLRDSLNEAQEKEQIGLLIWPTWNQWDDLSLEIRHGNDYYNFALSQVTKNEEATLSITWSGLKMPGILVVPVQKLLDSEDFFNHVLDICEKSRYTGPITLLPLNQLCSCS